MEKGLFYVVTLAFIKMGLGKMFLVPKDKRLSVVTGKNRESVEVLKKRGVNCVLTGGVACTAEQIK